MGRSGGVQSKLPSVAFGSAEWAATWFFSLSAILVLSSASFARMAPILATLGGVATLLALIRRPNEAIRYVLYLWFFSPWLRRIVDYRAGFDDNNVLLLLPQSASCILFIFYWKYATNFKSGFRFLAVTFTSLVTFASVVGVVKGIAPSAVAIALLQLVPPILFGLSLGRVSARSLKRDLYRCATVGALLLGLYGLIQFAVLPAWDKAWLDAVAFDVNSFGSALPLQVRVFSLLNSPGVLAPALVWCIVVILADPPKFVPLFALLAATISLGLSLVRSSWIAIALLLLVIALRRIVPLAWVAVLVPAFLSVAVTAGSILVSVRSRFDDTISSGTTDTSFQARLTFQIAQFPQALKSIFGEGLGSTGAAARRIGGGGAFVDTDSGYLELLRTFGLFGMCILIVVLVATLPQIFRRSMDSPIAIFALSAPLYALFTNPLVVLPGVLLWTGVALAALTVPAEPFAPTTESDKP